MRDKEVKQDYRFLPEPNLPPLRLFHSCDLQPGDLGKGKVKVLIDDLERSMPVLPRKCRQQLMEDYGLSLFQAAFIVVSHLRIQYSLPCHEARAGT